MEATAKPRAKWRYDISTALEAARQRANALDADIIEPKVSALEAVLAERRFQDEKHGPIDKSPHTIGEWILIMEAELQEAKVALIKGGTGRDSVLSEIVQVVAVGFSCLEQHGVHEITGRSI